MQERRDPFLLVVRHEQVHRRDTGDDQHDELCEDLHADAGEENHSQPDDCEDQSAAEVLLQDDDDYRRRHDGRLHEAFEIVKVLVVFVEVFRHDQYKKYFDDLGRLHFIVPHFRTQINCCC